MWKWKTFFLIWISVSLIFSYVSIKLGIGYRNGIAPCHYGCAAFQGDWEEGGNYLVIHEHQIHSVEVGVSKHDWFAHFFNCVWLTPVILYTLVASDNSFRHRVSVRIFLFHAIAFQPPSLQILVPFHMVCWKCSFQTSLPSSFECPWSLSTLMSSYEAISVGCWISTRKWQ